MYHNYQIKQKIKVLFLGIGVYAGLTSSKMIQYYDFDTNTLLLSVILTTTIFIIMTVSAKYISSKQIFYVTTTMTV